MNMYFIGTSQYFMQEFYLYCGLYNFFINDILDSAVKQLEHAGCLSHSPPFDKEKKD